MAYIRIDDDRIQVRKSLLLPRIDNIIILVAEQNFLDYIKGWESQAKLRVDLTKAERKKLTLSTETLQGLKINGIQQ